LFKQWIRQFIRWQVRLCRRIDSVLIPEFSVDGNERFVVLARGLVRSGDRVADIGGGKTPFFAPDEVAGLGLHVIGVDICSDELLQAPQGAFCTHAVGAIEEVRGGGDCDLVIAQSVLEHVYDGRRAAEGIASFCSPGGTVITFCPNRRAWFARLNLLLPEKVKRFILFSVFPEKRYRQGFPAHYDGCTPGELRANFAMVRVEERCLLPFFTSSYFMFCVPLYALWRLCTFPLMKVWPLVFCETFIFIGTKASANDG